ncbi:MAG: D-glycero-beta-D-manno-heptose-7-phosphate kinase [Candidatus Kapaibacteriota bacterium]
MLSLNIDRVTEILSKAENAKVAVIGDVMLDRFYWGNVNRISPEAPVPVVELNEETYHLGGAANVASNLKSLGLQPILLGVLGNDFAAQEFITLAKNSGLNSDGLFIDKSRSTTVKTRIIANNQHVARIDKETRAKISTDAQTFFENYLKSINNLEAIIFEDYDKGVLSKELIQNIIAFAKKKNILVTVDPKQDNFFYYKGVDLFKPNKKEASLALGKKIDTKENVKQAGLILLESLQCKNLLITLGSEGMILFQEDGNIFSVPTRARQVSDVSGAGDTAIASYTAAIIGGANVIEAASIANFASGTVCEKPGVVSIEINDLLATIKRNGNY